MKSSGPRVSPCFTPIVLAKERDAFDNLKETFTFEWSFFRRAMRF
jgi:hypothetical protein